MVVSVNLGPLCWCPCNKRPAMWGLCNCFLMRTYDTCTTPIVLQDLARLSELMCVYIYMYL